MITISMQKLGIITFAGTRGNLKKENGASTAKLNTKIVALELVVWSIFNLLKHLIYFRADSVRVEARKAHEETGLKEEILIKPYRQSSIYSDLENFL